MGVLATLLFVLGMEPVRDILLDLPAVSLGHEGLSSLGLWGYFVLLVLSYVFVVVVTLRCRIQTE